MQLKKKAQDDIFEEILVLVCRYWLRLLNYNCNNVCSYQIWPIKLNMIDNPLLNNCIPVSNNSTQQDGIIVLYTKTSIRAQSA